MKQFVVCALVLVLVVVYVESVCVHNGIKYKKGDSYQDNCNKCVCGAKGAGMCHKMACPPKACRSNGKRYGAGEQFLDADGCNTCTCTKTGEAACTMKLCV